MKMDYKKLRFWILYHLSLLIISAAIASLMKYKQTGNALHPTVIVVFLIIFIMSISIGYFAKFIIDKVKQYNPLQLNKRILPALLIFYIIAYLIVSLSITLGVFGWFLYSGRDLTEFWTHLFKYELNFASLRFFIWLMFFTLAFFYILWQKSVKKEQKLREENLKYKYQNLKSRVNPHFLFNSLNTLSEIVYEDAKMADKYIQKLSRIYRYILDNEETDLISLNKEIEFVKDYIELQKVRDNDSILVDIDLQNTNKFQLVPVSLQILVENALKHNSRSEKTPLKIQVYMKDDYIMVANNIQRKNTMENSSKTGLINLKERVNLIIRKELVMQEVNNQFIVKLPFIQI